VVHLARSRRYNSGGNNSGSISSSGSISHSGSSTQSGSSGSSSNSGSIHSNSTSSSNGSTDRALCVIKRVAIGHLSIAQQRAAIAEVLLLQRVPPHAHVIRYHAAFVDATTTTDVESQIQQQQQQYQQNQPNHQQPQPQQQHLCIVMEYAPNGDLETLINALRLSNRYLHEDVVWRFLFQLCAGLQHLHAKRIVYVWNRMHIAGGLSVRYLACLCLSKALSL
jgi:serine/threonine protein kinase